MAAKDGVATEDGVAAKDGVAVKDVAEGHFAEGSVLADFEDAEFVELGWDCLFSPLCPTRQLSDSAIHSR